MTEERHCPQCGSKMTFTPDGRTLQCDRCGFHRRLTRTSLDSVAELEQLIRYAHNTSSDKAGRSLEASRDWESWPTLGATSAKEGDAEEGCFYLSRVLLHPFADDQARKEAWLALSQAYSDPAEKRRCLENVLAIDFYEPRARRKLAIRDGQLDREEVIDPDSLPLVTSDTAPEVVDLPQFSCPSCGGRMSYTPDRASLRCPYCDSVVVTRQATTAAIVRPDTLIPFSSTQQAAQRQLEGWLRHRGLLDARAGPLAGLYLPSWTFDAHGWLLWQRPADSMPKSSHPHRPDSGWTFNGPRPQVSKATATGDQVVDQAHLLADDLVTPATKNLPATFTKDLVSHNLDELVPYDPRYLTGRPSITRSQLLTLRLRREPPWSSCLVKGIRGRSENGGLYAHALG